MNEWSSTRSGTSARMHPGREALRVAACLAALFSLTSFAQNGTSNNSSNGQFRPEKVYTVTAVNERPDANKLLEINRGRVQQQKFAAANAERKRQLTEDSARLLHVASELNQDLARAGNGNLSAAEVAKAGMVEQLAHGVKEKMKLTVAAP